MSFGASWLGTFWSQRPGPTLIGKVTSMSGDSVPWWAGSLRPFPPGQAGGPPPLRE